MQQCSNQRYTPCQPFTKEAKAEWHPYIGKMIADSRKKKEVVSRTVLEVGGAVGTGCISSVVKLRAAIVPY